MKTRRIAHAIHSGGFYGAERVVSDLLANQSRSEGITAVLLAFLDRGSAGNELADRARAAGVEVIPFEVARGFGPGSLFRYAALLRKHRIDLVHSHGYKPNFFHLVGRLLGLHRVPLLITAHGYPRALSSLRSRLYHALDLRLCRSAEAMVAVSAETAAFITASNPGCRPLIIENGIDTALDPGAGRPVAALFPDGDADTPVIGSIGRLIPLKNHRLLIEVCGAVSAEHPCRLLIVGDGPLREELQARMAAACPPGTAAMVPFQKDVYAWMAGMDIIALPSLMEGLPMTLLEAGVLGKAVVCSRVGGMPDVVRDGENGLLVEAGDRESLRAALLELVREAGRRRRLGAELRKTVADRFDMAKTHARYLEAYRRVFAEGPAA